MARIQRLVARKPSTASVDLALDDHPPAFDLALASLVAEAKGELRERRVRLKRSPGPQRPQ